MVVEPVGKSTLTTILLIRYQDLLLNTTIIFMANVAVKISKLLQIKIQTAMLTNHDLLMAAAQTGIPILMSMGMSKLDVKLMKQ